MLLIALAISFLSFSSLIATIEVSIPFSFPTMISSNLLTFQRVLVFQRLFMSANDLICSFLIESMPNTIFETVVVSTFNRAC